MREPPALDEAGPSRRWSFGPAVFDERSLELKVNGVVTPAEPKAVEVLQHLLLHAGEVVTRDELMDAVWPGRILTENAVGRTVARLREALGDSEHALIKTVHGYGWRLVAPVSVEAVAGKEPPRFTFREGEAPHLRPEWRFERCLGRGGHGEVWLARHGTGEQRVFKYAYDAGGLAALKREITIFRLLRETAGADPPCVRLHRWNLEEPPYFIEAEYVAGGSLQDWAEAQGGATTVPLAVRLDIAAQIAEAVATAHAVGILHKDLKPANVFIEGDAALRVKLGDFGSGGVLDAARLQALGITRLGFTKTVLDLDTTSGTPLYLAPEVLTGQPFTAKADVYAVGVLLFQLVTGNFRKPLAPGWEREVGDELLREDIAEAAAGNPAERLSEAAPLAQRLRTLAERHAQRAAETQARAEAERARTELQRVAARRGWVRATLAILFAGLATTIGLSLYALRERDRAEASAATTQAVSDFLNRDLLASADPRQGLREETTVLEVVERAIAQVDARFGDQPEVAAQLYVTLGETLVWMNQLARARPALERALALYQALGQDGTEPTLLARFYLSWYWVNTSTARGVALLDEGADLGSAALGPAHPLVLRLRLEREAFGPGISSADGLQTAFEAFLRSNPVGADLVWAHERMVLGLIALSDFREARVQSLKTLEIAESALGRESFGYGSACLFAGLMAITQGLDGEAEELIKRAAPLFDAEQGRESNGSVDYLRLMAWLRMLQGRLDEAEALLQRFLKVNDWGAHYERYGLIDLAYVRSLQGRFPEAEADWRAAMAIDQRIDVPGSWESVWIRAGLADTLREQGRHAEAWELVRGTPTDAVRSQRPLPHLSYAHLRRVEGQLWQHEGQHAKAREALTEALAIYDARISPRWSWSQDTRRALESVPPE